MRVTKDRIDPPGGAAAEVLARRLSDAVRGRRTPKDSRGGNGAANGDLRTVVIEDPRRIVSEVGAAMLAQASAGTAEHSDDVVLIAAAIGERMGVAGTELKDLVTAARLHDIGKAWVPGELLEKPGPLTPEERLLMRQHTVVGERILRAVKGLDAVARLVRHSHERWDGRGYPDGLAASEIPLGSRIIFCADAFHAIRSDRPYRRGRSAREALAEVKRCAGTQFDPTVAGALEAVVRERNRHPGRGGGSARLFALLMCLVVGAAGTAVARSGVLGDPAPPPAGSAAQPPPACGTANCPTVAGPVGGLGAVRALFGEPGSRVLSPGLPGRVPEGITPGEGHAGGDPAEPEQGHARGHGKRSHKGRHRGRQKGSVKRHGHSRPATPAPSASRPSGGHGSAGSGGGSSGGGSPGSSGGNSSGGAAPSGGAAAGSPPAGGGGNPGGGGSPAGRASGNPG